MCLSLSAWFGLIPVQVGECGGPLRKHPLNPRYFTDDSGKAIYLAGSHTWEALQDTGAASPPPTFDFTRYLDWLQAHGHNMLKLWAWEQGRYSAEVATDEHWIEPNAYQRTGPGLALDGAPKFDLTRLNQSYLDRLRARAAEAGRRGMYVIIMLFNGWSIEVLKDPEYRPWGNNAWKGHPFNGSNNINGVDGDTNDVGSLLRFLGLGPRDGGRETHQVLSSPANPYQKVYVRRVVDSINDLDNVLYEISAESPASSAAWQYDMIRYIRAYEATKPKRHPVGMTVAWPGGSDDELFASPADWISPNNRTHDYLYDPPEATGEKVILSDTDHLCGVCGNSQWPWKSLTRGLNPIYMDVYDGHFAGESHHNPLNPRFVQTRLQLGYTLRYANKVNIAAMTPQGRLSSTGYCLANQGPKGAEYLVYRPSSDTSVGVDLSGTPGLLSVEWFAPDTGTVRAGQPVRGGETRTFVPPFGGDAVLYLRSLGTENRGHERDGRSKRTSARRPR